MPKAGYWLVKGWQKSIEIQWRRMTASMHWTWLEFFTNWLDWAALWEEHILSGDPFHSGIRTLTKNRLGQYCCTDCKNNIVKYYVADIDSSQSIHSKAYILCSHTDMGGLLYRVLWVISLIPHLWKFSYHNTGDVFGSCNKQLWINSICCLQKSSWEHTFNVSFYKLQCTDTNMI